MVRRARLAAIAAMLLVGGMAAVIIPASPAGATVPAGFTDQLVVGVGGGPTALAFTPDGRMLVTRQSGTLLVVENGVPLPTPAVDLTAKICANSERGLLGVAVDPAFAANGYVFLYYSFDKVGDCGIGTVNRVARFVMTGNALGGEVVLVDNIPSPAGNHNAGDLQFGKDGTLYVSVGDGGCDYPGGTPSGCGGSNDAARDLHVLVGKILRIDRDGNIPAGNPFTGQATARCNVNPILEAGQICQETFAWGLRNPFRMAFDPNAPATRFYINDVGQGAWEEIDLGAAGADYGWNVREGHCATGSIIICGAPPTGMTNPIFDYGRADGCTTITGGAFVPNGTWPAEYQGKYLFADFGCGKIFRLDPNGSGGFTRTDFATNLGATVDLEFGPVSGGQALYYTTYAGGGQVRRIVHASTTPIEAAPIADFDGTGTTDISVFRPGNNTWYLRTTSPTAVVWGAAGDIPVPADYDGNGTVDVAVFRPGNNTWYLRTASPTAVVWGQAGDIPVPADYDGNGTVEIAVFRPGNNTWYLRTAGPTAVVWGQTGDVPVPGDYDGNGTVDIAVFRPGNNTWYLRTASPTALVWGQTGDVPVPGDYDGNGTADLAVFRPGNGAWYLRTASPMVQVWGQTGDFPVPGDYDGNGSIDLAVFRPATNTWFVRTASPFNVVWGTSGDRALPLARAIQRVYFP